MGSREDDAYWDEQYGCGDEECPCHDWDDYQDDDEED